MFFQRFINHRSFSIWQYPTNDENYIFTVRLKIVLYLKIVCIWDLIAESFKIQTNKFDFGEILFDLCVNTFYIKLFSSAPSFILWRWNHIHVSIMMPIHTINIYSNQITITIKVQTFQTRIIFHPWFITVRISGSVRTTKFCTYFSLEFIHCRNNYMKKETNIMKGDIYMFVPEQFRTQ